MMVNKRHDKVFKIVLGGLLTGWYLKMPVFYWTYLNETTFALNLDIELFPSFFENPYTAQFFYFLPLFTVITYFIKNESFLPTVQKISSAFLAISSLMLLLHSATYNDATFVTSFWVSCWLFWFSFHAQEKYNSQACKLATAIVSMIFFGGFIGKLSSEWASGEVVFGLIQSTFTYWPFSWINNNTTYDQLKVFSMIMSWAVIAFELILATCFLWPLKISLKYTPAMIAGVVFFRSWQILSVIGCLIVLLAACNILNEKTNHQIN